LPHRPARRRPAAGGEATGDTMTASATVASASRGSPQPHARLPERPLSLCFVSADYPTTSPTGVGGLGAHTSALAHAIAELGHDVSVLTQSEKGYDHHLDGSVNVHAIPVGSRRLWKLGRVLPVPWLRRSYAVARELNRQYRRRPFDLVSFPDGYGEGF